MIPLPFKPLTCFSVIADFAAFRFAGDRLLDFFLVVVAIVVLEKYLIHLYPIGRNAFRQVFFPALLHDHQVGFFG